VAFANDLVVVPVLNKIDLPRADIEGSKDQVRLHFSLVRQIFVDWEQQQLKNEFISFMVKNILDGKPL